MDLNIDLNRAAGTTLLLAAESIIKFANFLINEHKGGCVDLRITWVQI